MVSRHYFEWLTPQTCFKVNFSKKLSYGDMYNQRYMLPSTYVCKVTHATIFRFFDTKSERATQTGLFKGSDVITWHYFPWVTRTPHTVFKF